ncbi:hypothetical protein [Burkholderia cepacia]|uniref:hypothetical protein n=1 Tax=Burkholderia cepacia TaxID=292 RepID=UPI001F325F4C|nr:hypothetical protein [Burkholderia cepacia]MCE4129598.1 hypothetical protein [Burkholderia cepacia]
MLRVKSANAANGRIHIGSSQAPTLPFGTQTFAQITRAEVRQQPIDAVADTLLPINRNDCPPTRAHPDAAPVGCRSSINGRRPRRGHRPFSFAPPLYYQESFHVGQ